MSTCSVENNIQLPPHRVKFACELGLRRLPVYVGGDGIEVDLVDHAVEEVADRFGMPPSAANLEPGEMSAQRCCAEHCVRVLLELLKRDGFVHRDLYVV